MSGGVTPQALSPVERPRPNPSPEGEGLRITGYAAVFDRVDRAGDVFRAGAFAGAVPVPLLWQHRGAAVGEVLAIGEDATGLWIEANVRDPHVAGLVRSGALRGLSVGFCAVAAWRAAWREITRAALIEVSLVAVPMQSGAWIERVAGTAADPHQQDKRERTTPPEG